MYAVCEPHQGHSSQHRAVRFLCVHLKIRSPAEKAPRARISGNKRTSAHDRVLGICFARLIGHTPRKLPVGRHPTATSRFNAYQALQLYTKFVHFSISENVEYLLKFNCIFVYIEQKSLFFSNFCSFISLFSEFFLYFFEIFLKKSKNSFFLGKKP